MGMAENRLARQDYLMINEEQKPIVVPVASQWWRRLLHWPVAWRRGSLPVATAGQDTTFSYAEEPLNKDTSLIRTLSAVPIT